jgi:SH3-like domain-containing protein
MRLFFLFIALAAPPISLCAQEDKLKEPLTMEPRNSIKGSGLPIPRFVSTKARKVKLRVGPGDYYPSRTVYIQKNIPLMVVAEFEFWRKIRDFDAEEGWVHKSLLMDSKDVWVQEEMTPLLSSPNKEASILAHLKKRSACRLLKIFEDYAKVSINDHTGWVISKDLWGILPE